MRHCAPASSRQGELDGWAREIASDAERFKKVSRLLDCCGANGSGDRYTAVHQFETEIR